MAKTLPSNAHTIVEGAVASTHEWPARRQPHQAIAAMQGLRQGCDPQALLRRAMEILLVAAGAQDVWLLQCQENSIHARAHGSEGPPVQLATDLRLVGETDLPLSIISAALSCGREATLEAPDMQPQYAHDPYFRHHHPRSIVCIPMLQAGQADRLIYLERRSACEQGLLEMLRVLTTEIASALEMADLRQQVQREVAERERAQEDLRQSEQGFRLLAEYSQDLIMRLSPAGVFLYLSPVCQALIGYAPQELVGRPAATLIHPEDLQAVARAWALAHERPISQTTKYRVLCKDGTCKWLETTSRGVWDLQTGSMVELVASARDMTERQQVEVALRELACEREQQAVAAKQLALMRSDFVAAVSHELRTPLAAVLGYAELLQGRWSALDDQQRKSRVDRIVVAANRQRRLIEDLLQVSRVETSDPEYRRLPVALDTLIMRVADETQENYTGQVITMTGPTDLCARADASHVEQILTNLLDNAAKYSPEGSAVDVTWANEASQVAIRVRDAGPGIPEHGRDALFTRFGRVPGSSIRAGHVGTGLGLYLGRRFAESMGGQLDLESTGPEGTVFCLRLPIASS